MADFILGPGSYASQRTLTGGEHGILTDQTSNLVVADDAIVASGSQTNTMIVNGLVTSTTNTGIAIRATGYGATIQVGSGAMVTTLANDAINASYYAAFYLRNAGIITSNSEAIIATASDNGAQTHIINSGTIEARQTAVYVDSGTISSSIINTGTIVSHTNNAIRHNLGSGSTGIAYFNNTGDVIATNTAYSTSQGPGANYVSNAGRIVGNMLLGAGDDRYEGPSGTMIGVVFGEEGQDSLSGGLYSDFLDGGTGNDILVGRGGDDSLTGGAENDTLLGGAGSDSMEGGTGNDTLIGNNGNDTMTGDDGADVMVGQDGADNMDGGNGDDTMDGGNGDDILEGGADNDILRGRAGEDDLAGGLGRDFLTGGQDADTFVFRAIAETVVGANRDQILDFEQGMDLIVVAGMSPGVFEFRGTNAFAPSGNPELRLLETATGSTIVQLDANGDGNADAEIRVANVTGLTAEDFVL